MRRAATWQQRLTCAIVTAPPTRRAITVRAAWPTGSTATPRVTARGNVTAKQLGCWMPCRCVTWLGGTFWDFCIRILLCCCIKTFIILKMQIGSTLIELYHTQNANWKWFVRTLPYSKCKFEMLCQNFHYTQNANWKRFVGIVLHSKCKLEMLCQNFIMLKMQIGNTLSELYYAQNADWKHYVKTLLYSKCQLEMLCQNYVALKMQIGNAVSKLYSTQNAYWKCLSENRRDK